MKTKIFQTTDRLIWMKEIDEGLWQEIDHQDLTNEDLRLLPPRPLTEKELEWAKKIAQELKEKE